MKFYGRTEELETLSNQLPLLVPGLSLLLVEDESEKPRSLLSSLENLRFLLSTFLYSEAIQRTT